MKLLVLASRFPWPLEKGDKLRLYHQLRLLSRKHKIVLVALSRVKVSPGDIAAIEPFCEAVHVFHLGQIGNAWSLLKTVFSKKPFQAGLFYRKKIANRIGRIATDWQPDRVFCQLVRMAPYASELKYPVTFDFMDAFSVGMKRRAGRSRWPANWLFAEESRRLAVYEKALLGTFDDCTIIAKPDAEAIGKGIRIVPNGVDLEYFSLHKRSQQPEYQLVFVGNMGYYPNVQAASSLVKAILPKLQTPAKVLLAGARPSPVVKRLESESVSVSGWVEDIRDAYRAGQIFVAPLFTGSGQQNKLLEAMALGIPCITTPIVAGGLGVEGGKHLLIAGTVEKFASEIDRLLHDEALQKTLSKEGRIFVEKKFSWKQAVYQLFS